MSEIILIFVFIYCFFVIDASDFFSERCEDNCIFTEEFLNSKTLKAFPSSCSTVCADIKIDQNTNLSAEQLTEAFKTMKIMCGTLHVSNTNYTSGKFLNSLEIMECEGIGGFTWEHNNEMTEMGLTNLITCFCDIEIYSNSKMIRLNMPKLKNFSSSNSTIRQVEMTIQYVSPEFCITIQEMQIFISNKNLYMSRMPDKYCKFTTYSDSGGKHCLLDDTTETTLAPGVIMPINRSTNFKDLESDCDTICGVVEIGAGDEEMVHKLDKLKLLYGRLIIRDTELTSVDFLSNLEYVASLEGLALFQFRCPLKTQTSLETLKRPFKL
ncbi:hypothetical protein GCK72_019570 [Caenorhabditis remanei]|uniref:Receptor L-domain domain-containing protein n=1 Tax=Caenorhabditis remanei TaxID=31234 RepID=A0A6A5GE52_CAERE|nr:hypothetical protein GCK72_019570 [Caenorhabditis remanei]KAF1753014.1 hypothetical protein GCK72_019570 [Caenorhabditis remanei]